MTVKAGKALTGSVGLLAGQETMKAEAREYTSSKSRGVLKATGTGLPPLAPMRYVL
jgi:hypothetical protein